MTVPRVRSPRLRLYLAMLLAFAVYSTALWFAYRDAPMPGAMWEGR